MSWNEFWHWIFLGPTRPWMHGVMALVWLGLAAVGYFGEPAANRTEWLMFSCWAFGVQFALFFEKVNHGISRQKQIQR